MNMELIRGWMEALCEGLQTAVDEQSIPSEDLVKQGEAEAN